MKAAVAGLAWLASAVTASAGPLPPAKELLPPGFQVIEEQTVQNVMATVKGSSAATTIQIGWQQNPMADRMVSMFASQPEEKAKAIPSLFGREEPCGKERLRGGVLTCRRWTTRAAGSDGPPRITVKVLWQGAASNGLVSISIDDAGTREAATALLEAMIPRITKSR